MVAEDVRAEEGIEAEEGEAMSLFTMICAFLIAAALLGFFD
jgi:hypothetical protein